MFLKNLVMLSKICALLILSCLFSLVALLGSVCVFRLFLMCLLMVLLALVIFAACCFCSSFEFTVSVSFYVVYFLSLFAGVCIKVALLD